MRYAFALPGLMKTEADIPRETAESQAALDRELGQDLAFARPLAREELKVWPQSVQDHEKAWAQWVARLPQDLRKVAVLFHITFT